MTYEIAELPTKIVRTFHVRGATPTMRDPSRCEFTPEEITVDSREGHRPHYIEVKGRRTKTGRITRTAYRIAPDGMVEPHHRNGPAPDWLAELISRCGPYSVREM